MDGEHIAATDGTVPAEPVQPRSSPAGDEDGEGEGDAMARSTSDPSDDPGAAAEPTAAPVDPAAPSADAGADDLAAAERTAFLELVSHELRTPVTTIHAAAAILRARPPALTEDLRDELVEDISDETERLRRVVDDLLVLAQLEAGLGLAREPLLLQRLVPPLLEHERRRRPGHRIELREAAALPVVRGDELGVRQIVRDLVADAGLWRSRAPITVELGPNASGAHVRVIHDHRRRVTGRRAEGGPAHAAQERMPTSGSVGLYTCARLAKAMGGFSWARPRADGRTERGLWLPAFTQMADD